MYQILFGIADLRGGYLLGVFVGVLCWASLSGAFVRDLCCGFLFGVFLEHLSGIFVGSLGWDYLGLALITGSPGNPVLWGYLRVFGVTIDHGKKVRTP